MSEIIATIANLERLPNGPRWVCGDTGKKYFVAEYNAALARHEARVPIAEWIAVQPDIVKGCHRSYCKWALVAVAEVASDRERELAHLLEEAQAEIATLKLSGRSDDAPGEPEMPPVEAGFGHETKPAPETTPKPKFREVRARAIELSKLLGVGSKEYAGINKLADMQALVEKYEAAFQSNAAAA